MKFASSGFESIVLTLPNQLLIRLFQIIIYFAVMLQASCHTAHMVTKSQKVHISKDDGLPNFIISTLLKIGSGFPRVAGICPSLKNVYNLSSNRSFILWVQSIHQINICRKPSFPMKVSLIVLATLTLT